MYQYLKTDDECFNATIYNFTKLSTSKRGVKATNEETSTYRTPEERSPPHQREAAYEETRDDVEDSFSTDSFQNDFVASDKSMSNATDIVLVEVSSSKPRTTNLSTEKNTGTSSDNINKKSVMNKCLNASKAQKIPLSNKMESIVLKMQKEGKERREKIERAIADKIQYQQRNYKTISTKEAANLYNRGMASKARLEQRREEESEYPYTSPLLNSLIVVEENTPLPRSTSTSRAPRASSVPTRHPKRLEQKESTMKGDHSQMMPSFMKKTYTPIRTHGRVRIVFPTAFTPSRLSTSAMLSSRFSNNGDDHIGERAKSNESSLQWSSRGMAVCTAVGTNVNIRARSRTPSR